MTDTTTPLTDALVEQFATRTDIYASYVGMMDHARGLEAKLAKAEERGDLFKLQFKKTLSEVEHLGRELSRYRAAEKDRETRIQQDIAAMRGQK